MKQLSPFRVSRLLALVFTCFVAGCHSQPGDNASNSSSKPGNKAEFVKTAGGLASNAVLVASGPDIVYHPPGDGTCVLVDQESGNTIRTQSAKAGDFQFNRYRAGDSRALQDAGVDPDSARLVLYFVPDYAIGTSPQ